MKERVLTILRVGRIYLHYSSTLCIGAHRSTPVFLTSHLRYPARGLVYGAGLVDHVSMGTSGAQVFSRAVEFHVAWSPRLGRNKFIYLFRSFLHSIEYKWLTFLYVRYPFTLSSPRSNVNLLFYTSID